MLRNTLNTVDDKLGAMIEKEVPINLKEIEGAINENLARGMGIKQMDRPISVELQHYGKFNKSNRDFNISIGGNPTGYMRLEPITVPRSFTEIITGRSRYMPQFRNASGPGL